MGGKYAANPNEARFRELMERHDLKEAELRDFLFIMVQEIKFLADCAQLPEAAAHLHAAAHDIDASRKARQI